MPMIFNSLINEPPEDGEAWQWVLTRRMAAERAAIAFVQLVEHLKLARTFGLLISELPLRRLVERHVRNLDDDANA